MDSVGWKWLETDVLPLTAELAESFAALPHFEGDRPWATAQGRRRMNWLSRLVDEGKFYPPKWATVEFDDKLWRMNGGTSSHMLIQRNGHFPTHLVAVVDRFECYSLEGVADLFDQFDPKKSLRTMIQRLRAHRPAENDLARVSPTDINIILGGIGAAVTNFAMIDDDDKIGLIHDYPGFIRWAAPYARKRHLRSRGVVAAIFDTYGKDSVYARGFWSEVADKSNPDNQHPTRVLAEFLQVQVGLEAKKKFTARMVYTKCVHAWNAARRNQRTALKIYKRTNLPKLV